MQDPRDTRLGKLESVRAGTTSVPFLCSLKRCAWPRSYSTRTSRPTPPSIGPAIRDARWASEECLAPDQGLGGRRRQGIGYLPGPVPCCPT